MERQTIYLDREFELVAFEDGIHPILAASLLHEEPCTVRCGDRVIAGDARPIDESANEHGFCWTLDLAQHTRCGRREGEAVLRGPFEEWKA